MKTLASPTLLLCSLSLSACSSYGGKAGTRGLSNTDDECGQNSVTTDNSCECVDLYEWCDDVSTDCCAYGTDEFEIVLESFSIFPFVDSATGEPWDWDGDIPDDIIELLNIIGYVQPEVKTFAEVLEIVDEVAPIVLEGTVPPDPWVDFYQGEDYLDSTGTFDDTYTVRPGTHHNLDLSRGDWEFEVWDEDIVDHDFVGYSYVTLDDAQFYAGGTAQFSQHPLWEIEVRVEPVW